MVADVTTMQKTLSGDAPLVGSAVTRTVKQLSKLSLTSEDGAYLGSESDLLERFQVSRPTLRQAAKVVESDRLVSVRRGVNGGFYAARPDSSDVVRGPALWLRLHDATLMQMLRASALIMPTIASEAAQCRDEALRDKLREFRDDLDRREQSVEVHRESVAWDSALMTLMGKMAGDPVLRLFADIGYVFGVLQRDSALYKHAIDRQREWMTLQRRLCTAILDGDSDLAKLVAIRRSEVAERWIAEDLARNPHSYGPA